MKSDTSVSILSLTSLLFLAAGCVPIVPPIVLTWIAVNVPKTVQGDAHLIKSPNGKVILIDAGEIDEGKELLIPVLDKEQITKIDAIFITHPHSDHYGGVIALLQKKLPIDKIYLYPITKDLCDKESPWGCVWDDLETLRKLAADNHVEIDDYSNFSRFEFSDGVYMDKIMQAPPDLCPTYCNINDTSFVSQLNVGPTKVLFTGDLNKHSGGWLLEHHPELLPATILKAPHHGTNGTVPDDFIKKVNPELTIIPAQSTLWCADRSKRIRDVLQTTNSKVEVNGIQGDVRIDFKIDGSYTVSPTPISIEESCANPN